MIRKQRGCWLAALFFGGVLACLRPPAWVALAGLCVIGIVLWWSADRVWHRSSRLVTIALGAIAILRPHQNDEGYGRLFVDQTYHHQALRALNQAAAQGADINEVLEATSHIKAGDAQGWYQTWTALGDRNLARANATHDTRSKGEALLRAHTYYLRSEFFLSPNDPKRIDSFGRNRKAFYDGLDTLGVAHEKIPVPFEGHQLNAVFYPAAAPAHAQLIVFCGGSDTTLEELYFFLVAAAHARGYSVLTFEGPGQGSVAREQHVPMTPDWEKPTSAILDAWLASHAPPSKIVLVGLSLGGYLAARAAAFDERIDGVVSYDVFYDGAAITKRIVPSIAYGLRSFGLESLVNVGAPIKARFDPSAASSAIVGQLMFGKTEPLQIADELSKFTLADVAGRIKQDVLLLAGVDDQFVPSDQIEQFRKALVNARSVTAKIYDRPSGGSAHSQLGATTLWQADFFDWLGSKFPDYGPR